MPHLDATPENSNGEHCKTCKAAPGWPCIYSTRPPIARDRMHYDRVEAARLTELARASLESVGRVGAGSPLAVIAALDKVFEDWGINAWNDHEDGDDDFAEAVRESGAWRLARDLRAARKAK